MNNIIFWALCLLVILNGAKSSEAIKPIIIVHGGASDVLRDRVQGKLDGVRAAVREGYKELLNGGSALDAVEVAVISMEANEYFNAGFGSALNVRGEVSMDASIMSGTNLDAGAVTLVKEFSHPISIARRLLSDSQQYYFLGGEGAKIFALKKGFQQMRPESLVSDYAKKHLQEHLSGEKKLKHPDLGAVGAVAIDSQGHIAAATSSGGLTGKPVGHISGTPQVSSSTYADDNIGGVSCTGNGEAMTKYGLAYTIIKLMENGMDAETAAKLGVEGMTARLNDTNVAGVISLSKYGEVGIHFSSNTLTWAYIKDDRVFYGINKDEVMEDNF